MSAHCTQYWAKHRHILHSLHIVLSMMLHPRHRSAATSPEPHGSAPCARLSPPSSPTLSHPSSRASARLMTTRGWLSSASAMLIVTLPWLSPRSSSASHAAHRHVNASCHPSFPPGMSESMPHRPHTYVGLPSRMPLMIRRLGMGVRSLRASTPSMRSCRG